MTALGEARKARDERAQGRRMAKAGSDMSRLQNLIALVGTVTRCECGKQGFLTKVGVESEPRFRKQRYFAEWEHPDPDEPGCASVCEYVWP